MLINIVVSTGTPVAIISNRLRLAYIPNSNSGVFFLTYSLIVEVSSDVEEVNENLSRATQRGDVTDYFVK